MSLLVILKEFPDEYEEDECGMYFRFGSVWVSVHEDMGEDE